MNMQVLSRPVFGIDGDDGDVLIGQKCNQMFAGRAASGENRGCGSRQDGQSAGNVDLAAARFKNG